MVFSSNYAGDAKSRNTGCNLCSSIPQKGQKGLEKLFKVQDSVEDLKSSGYLGMRKIVGEPVLKNISDNMCKTRRV